MTTVYIFFNDTATTEIYTLSLHDALPISIHRTCWWGSGAEPRSAGSLPTCCRWAAAVSRSEEHTSELQSQSNLVCRLLLEKKKKPKCATHSRYPCVATSGCALHPLTPTKN